MSEQDKASLIFNKDETRRTIRENTDLVGDSDNPVIEIRKPRQEQWIKCRGKSLEDLHWKDLVFLQDQDTMKEEGWLLNGDEDTLKKLRNTFEGVTRPSILVPCIDQTGTEFLWIVKQPGKGMRMTLAHSTGKVAVENAQKGWRKIYWKPGYGYVSMKPVDPDAIDDQKFTDKLSIEEICFNAFDGRIIDTMDHVQVKVWRGQKLNG